MAAFKNKDNGTWYVQFRYTDWRGERQQKMKRGFLTKKAALAWEREFLMKKQADLNMTLESFVELYENDIKPKLKLNTWLTKECIIQKKILPYLGKRKLSEITPQDIFCWQNEIRKITDKKGTPLSPTYLKTIHNQMSAIFNHAVRYYGLQSNPAAKAGSMGEKEATEMQFWTKEEFLKVMDAMMDSPIHYYAIFFTDKRNRHNTISEAGHVRTLADLISLIYFYHTIAHTNMCLDVLRGLLCWLQLFPQCCHKYPQGSHIVIPTAAPDILCDKGMGQYLANILGQQTQQLILNGCQVKFVFIQISASPGIIHFQLTIHKYRTGGYHFRRHQRESSLRHPKSSQ